MLLAVVDFTLSLVVAVDLCGVMMFDTGHELVEHIEELRGAFVGEARQVKRQDERLTFHDSA
jgi:hypothetical protein